MSDPTNREFERRPRTGYEVITIDHRGEAIPGTVADLIERRQRERRVLAPSPLSLVSVMPTLDRRTGEDRRA